MIAVLFEANIVPGQQKRYLQLAMTLKPLLADIDGFIAIERFESLTASGKILSLSWWRDEKAVLLWKQNLLHREAQIEGQKAIFAFYRIRIANVFKDYSSKTRGLANV